MMVVGVALPLRPQVTAAHPSSDKVGIPISNSVLRLSTLPDDIGVTGAVEHCIVQSP